MFDAIAPTYERVNAVVSLGQDAAWRRRAVAAANVQPTDVVLDICCGTGDMLRAFASNTPAPRLLLGVDFAGRMLAAGRYDRPAVAVQLLRADGLRLPLADVSVDITTCAFGVRNFQDLPAGLAEMRRVLRPGGRCVILEFALPDNRLLRVGYRLYTERILPRIAALVSRDRSGAYDYLPQSIRTFDRATALADRLRAAGFSDVTLRRMNLGGVVVYRAVK